MSCGPLHGIQVLDITHMYAGPYCGQWLGDMGAEVIKVESIGRGDRIRYGPPSTMKNGQMSYNFLAVNRNKRSIAADLDTEEGRLIVYRLVERSDVFLHNLRAATVNKLALAYEDLKQINSGLVYASISGFGDEGPYKDLPGQGLQVQAMAGLMSITGYPYRVSVPAGEAVADAVTGLLTAFGVLAALYARNETGAGQEVKTSLFAGLISLFLQQIAGYMDSRQVPRKAETGSPYSVPPFGAWRTRDGKEIAISTWRDEPWIEFCHAIDRPALAEDPRFDSTGQRWEHQEELRAIIREALSQKTRDEWIRLLRGQGQWVVPVRNFQEVCTADTQLSDNGLLVELQHPEMGPTTVFGMPIKLSETPFTARQHPPSTVSTRWKCSRSSATAKRRSGSSGGQKRWRDEPASAALRPRPRPPAPGSGRRCPPEPGRE